MAWDDIRVNGQILDASDWNALVSYVKFHKEAHGSGGDDEITPESIGAAPVVHEHTIGDISDITITDPETGQLLIYDGDKWINTQNVDGGTA